MHGEYKVPDGKLVVVDLEVEDGRLRNVEVSGDFFLLPEDAIWRITRSLDGALSSETQEMLARRVRDVTAGVELIGITPEGVAVAVQRALESERE